jgi:hypothetical protein
VATFPADILLQVKTKGVQQQLTKVENFFNRIDNKAKIVEQRLEKLRNPQGFRVAINDKAFDKVVQKSRKINSLVDRTNNLIAQRTARLNKENSLTNGLVSLEKKRRDLVRERLRDEAQVTGELKRQQRFLAGKSNQYLSPIGPSRPKARTRRGGPGRLQQAALGVGFPLLFGGGVGSIAGGLIGSGGGFGGQILGSAIGQQVDQFITKAAELGQALNPLTGDFEKVAEAAGLSGSALGKLIQEYESVAGKEAALAEATEALSRAIGQDAVDSLEKFGEESLRLSNELTIALTSISAAVADIINKTGILRALADNLEFVRNRDRGLENRGNDPTLARLIEERDRFNRGILFGGDSSKVFEAEQAIAARQAELDIIKQTEQTNRLIAATEAEKTREVESNLVLAKQRLIIELGNNDLLNESVVTAKRAIAAEETRLAIIEAQGDARLIELAFAEAAIKKAEIDNAVAAAKQRQADLEARLANKGAGSADQAARKELQAQKAISAEKAKQFELEVKLQTLGETELSQVQIQLDNFDKITSLKRNQIILATEDARVEAEKLQTLDLQRAIERDQLVLQRESLELAKETQAIQARQGIDSLQRGLSQELAGITAPSGNQNLDERNAQALAQAQRYENVLADINNQLELQRVLATSADKSVREDAQDRINVLQQEKDVWEQMLPQIFAAEQAQLKFNQVLRAATPYAQAFANGLTQGLRDVVAGTKTAEEAFADFLNGIADMLIQTAATMIAQYIAIGIARSFAGMKSPGAPLEKTKENFFGPWEKVLTRGYAEGGYVTGPTPAVVGEGGEPEYIIPASKMESAMARYSSGTRGDAVIDGPGSTEGGGGGVATADAPISITVEGGITQIGNDEFVRKDQLPAIVAQASKAGEARTMRRLQMNPGARRKIGM